VLKLGAFLLSLLARQSSLITVFVCRAKELVHRVHFKAENKNTFHILGVEVLPSEAGSGEALVSILEGHFYVVLDGF
jgi:hypothetical protein